jgi:type II secretion system protein G
LAAAAFTPTIRRIERSPDFSWRPFPPEENTLKLLFSILLPLIALSACSDRTEQARHAIEALLPVKKHVEYREVQAFPGDVVCGELSYPDPVWGNSGFRRFIVWGEQAMDTPSDDDWEIFCSEDPAAALYSRLGIGPLQEQRKTLDQVVTDMAAIRFALEAYLADSFVLPSSEQGLQALSVEPQLPPQAIRYRAGGYLNPIPTDPWGRPYLYGRSSLGGVSNNYLLQTLGADGAPGGKGADADISMEQLKYIDFVSK